MNIFKPRRHYLANTADGLHSHPMSGAARMIHDPEVRARVQHMSHLEVIA